MRYIVIFRLDRGPKAVRNGRSYGSFTTAGESLNPYTFGRRQAHCFGGVVMGRGGDTPETARHLDNVKRGERVRVGVRPLTLKGAKNKLIDQPYVRRPRMRVSAVNSGLASYTLSRPSDFTNASAKRAIHRLDCT